MGIKDLNKLIQQHSPNSIQPASTQQFVNQKIAIDASVLLYQFLTTIVTRDGQPLTNNLNQPTSHIIGLLARCTRFAEAGVKPIFVFDGDAGDAKSNELSRRKQVKEQNEAKAEQAREEGDAQEALKYARRSVRVTKEISAQAKKLLGLLGIPVIQAPGEAEILCVQLCKQKFCSAVASSDFDVVAHQCPVFIRNIGTDKEITQIVFGRLLEDLGLGKEEFIDLCILMGCDYVDTIPGIGPKTAFNLIKKHGKIEEIVREKGDKIADKEAYLASVEVARRIFLNSTEEKVEFDAKFGVVKQQELIDFLVNEMQFDANNAQQKVQKYVNSKKSTKQTTLSGFIKKVK